MSLPTWAQKSLFTSPAQQEITSGEKYIYSRAVQFGGRLLVLHLSLFMTLSSSTPLHYI